VKQLFRVFIQLFFYHFVSDLTLEDLKTAIIIVGPSSYKYLLEYLAAINESLYKSCEAILDYSISYPLLFRRAFIISPWSIFNQMKCIWKMTLHQQMRKLCNFQITAAQTTRFLTNQSTYHLHLRVNWTKHWEANYILFSFQTWIVYF